MVTERKGVIVMMTAGEKALAEAVAAHYPTSTGRGNFSEAVRQLLEREALRINGGWPTRAPTGREGKLQRLAVVVRAKATVVRQAADDAKAADREQRTAARAVVEAKHGVLFAEARRAGWVKPPRMSYANARYDARRYLNRHKEAGTIARPKGSK